jgi:hypothetical protein
LEGSKDVAGIEDSTSGTGQGKGAPGPASDAPDGSPNSDRTADTPGQGPSEDGAEATTTPEEQAERGSEERLRGLLKAYQQALEAVEDLPAVVWVPWDTKGPGCHLRVPYLRLFLGYFVAYHVDGSLNALSRRFDATAALSEDPDANRAEREAVKLYLQSLPRPPYAILVFFAVLAALVVALPLQGFGNVFYVLDIVGAVLRFNVGYVGRALEGNELGPTLRSLIVLVVGLIVVGAVLTSPFGLKRMLFNLHPRTKEGLKSTAAGGHGLRVEGLYALEEGVSEEAGVRRPHEGRWDLAFQTFLLSLLLLIGVCLAGLTLVVFMQWNVHLNLDTGAPAEVHFFLPKLSWGYYALFSGVVFGAFALLLRRLLKAWKRRSRKAIG